jgi:hypothetical protein
MKLGASITVAATIAASVPVAASGLLPPNEHLQCSSSDGGGGCSDLVGYRDGQCRECDCCPACWTCVELHAYRCAERNGLGVEHTSVDLGTLVVGAPVFWSVSTNRSSSRSSSTTSSSAMGIGSQNNSETVLATEGWLQCAAFPSLPPGLSFSDDGTLSGALLPSAPGAADYFFEGKGADGNAPAVEVIFFATSVAGWEQSGAIRRLEVRFALERTAPTTTTTSTTTTRATAAHSAARSAALEAAHGHVRTAFGAYGQWERRALSHGGCVGRMGEELKALAMVLGEHPTLAGGQFWGWLGGAHMNLHKLLENVLLECELFLGLALLFPSQDVRTCVTCRAFFQLFMHACIYLFVHLLLTILAFNPQTNERTNERTNQPINQSTNQPINQSTNHHPLGGGPVAAEPRGVSGEAQARGGQVPVVPWARTHEPWRRRRRRRQRRRRR